MATVRDLVRLAVRAAEEKKAQDVRALDVRGISSVTDYMIVATGSSDTNVRAIAEGVREKLAARGERPLSAEGFQEGTWVLLDYVDFVVHVFHAEKRLFFGLEQLWADAKQVPLPAARTGAAAGRTAAAPAKAPARTAARESAPPAPRRALKPAARKSSVPKKAGGGTKSPAPRKSAVPRKKKTG
jgi:ribosome-associated protein